MARRRLHRIASAGIVAISAAALASPAAAWACGAGSGDSECCCSARGITIPSDCHDSTTPRADCVTKSCPCCRPAVPQNVPPKPTLLQLTAAAAPADVPWFHGGSEFSIRINGHAPANLTAIPHRILHCSWLI